MSSNREKNQSKKNYFAISLLAILAVLAAVVTFIDVTTLIEKANAVCDGFFSTCNDGGEICTYEGRARGLCT